MAKEMYPGSIGVKTAVETDVLPPKEQKKAWIFIVALTLFLLYGYLNNLIAISGHWANPQYSHGYLIPLFAMVLLWLERKPFTKPTNSDLWWGVALIASGLTLRLTGTRFLIYSFEHISLLPCIAGIFVLAGGVRVLRWATAPICFLYFMYPWPTFLVYNMMNPLQGVATRCSLYAMQTFGVEAYREGNVIFLDKMQMGVVEACSGLRMLTIFLALSVAIAMLATTRPWWERLVIVLSAIPIALTVNIFRITVTGLLYSLNVKEEIAKMVFHDFAGYIMMPMALGLLYLEYQILSRLIIEDTSVETISKNINPAGSPPTVNFP